VRSLLVQQITHSEFRITAPLNVDAGKLLAFQPLLDWMNNTRKGLLEKGAVLHDIAIRDVYMAGSRVLFVFLDANITMEGRRLPGAVMLRGESVAVLLWCKCGATFYAIMVKQPRVATGDEIWEAPAGIVEAGNAPKGAAFTEICEETGIIPDPAKMKHIGSFLPSPGLLDETIQLFECEQPDMMEKCEQRCARGNFEEGELITSVAAVPVQQCYTCIDAKMRCLVTAAVDSGIFDE